MYKNVSLSALRPGETAIVDRLLSKKEIRRRLMDMGLVEGTVLECALTAPSGDPSAYRIRGGVIAIRQEDAQDIMVLKEERL